MSEIISALSELQPGNLSRHEIFLLNVLNTLSTGNGEKGRHSFSLNKTALQSVHMVLYRI